VLRQAFDPESLDQLELSIARDGLLQPLVVAPVPGSPRFRIVAGHRRFICLQRLRRADAPCRLVPAGADELLLSAMENLQRADLTPVEEALWLRAMLDAGHPAPRLATLARRSSSWIDQRLALLDYPEDLRAAIHAAGMPVSVGQQLARIDHSAYRARLIEDWRRFGATASTVAVWVAAYLADQHRHDVNEAMVEDLIARRDAYRVLVNCDYCSTPEALDGSRIWRLCRGCNDELRRTIAQAQAAAGGE
jgi:ParB/RepB/Spo0J family partition protein